LNYQVVPDRNVYRSSRVFCGWEWTTVG